jgi:hypothetical protein
MWNRSRIWPWLIIIVGLILAVYQLHNQGRLWICSCGQLLLWTSDAWGSNTSQHILDPYSFTHILHGFMFCGLLYWIVPKLLPLWRFCLAVLMETLWEIIENSNFVIQRYRETTAAFGYTGDTIVNSLGDILMCGLGFLIAISIGVRRSLILFTAIEVFLLIWIKDSLILNIIMLIYPIDKIKAWQMH